MGTIVEDFLTAEEEQKVVEAIKSAEKQTSGEIRVHLENYSVLDSEKAPQYTKTEVESRAKEVFHQLQMDTTKARNGVIIYVAVNLKQFYIYGDEGIHSMVGDDFWESTKDCILASFKKSEFAKGLCEGITEVGSVLKAHFPWETEDTNELPDEISKS